MTSGLSTNCPRQDVAVEELVKGADEIWALSEPGSSQQRALATDKPSEHVAASPPLLKAPHMRAAEMGHCRAIKQDQRRSFTGFPGKLPKLKTRSCAPRARPSKLVMRVRFSSPALSDAPSQGSFCHAAMRLQESALGPGHNVGPYFLV